MEQPKPFLTPPPDDPRIGYSVTRRADGGMNYVFTAADHETLVHWREFAARHLETADHHTRNRYDLRALTSISEEALKFALEAASDPAARNVRTAIVVASPAIGAALEEVGLISESGDLRVFHSIEDAEHWLTQPFSRLLKAQDVLAA